MDNVAEELHLFVYTYTLTSENIIYTIISTKDFKNNYTSDSDSENSYF